MKIAGLEVASMFFWTAWHCILMSVLVHSPTRSRTVSFSFSLLTTPRCPGLPGMHPHCSNLASLRSVSCLSRFTCACSLLTCHWSSVSIAFCPDRSFSIAAVFVVGPKAPVSFVISNWDSYWLHNNIHWSTLKLCHRCYGNTFHFMAIIWIRICVYAWCHSIQTYGLTCTSHQCGACSSLPQ